MAFVCRCAFKQSFIQCTLIFRLGLPALSSGPVHLAPRADYISPVPRIFGRAPIEAGKTVANDSGLVDILAEISSFPLKSILFASHEYTKEHTWKAETTLDFFLTFLKKVKGHIEFFFKHFPKILGKKIFLW